MRFRITPGSQVAIYKQIADQIRRAVASGELAVGDSCPACACLPANWWSMRIQWPRPMQS